MSYVVSSIVGVSVNEWTIIVNNAPYKKYGVICVAVISFLKVKLIGNFENENLT